MDLATKFFKRLVALVAVAILCVGCGGYLPATVDNPWQVITLPTDANPLDIGFTADPQHGWLVGTNSTLMETMDGGSTWEPRSLDLEQTYRLSSISFSGDEGWVAGQPSILLHTTDGGKSWSRVPLSEKLPGAPNTVVALGPESAEMTTSVGAIYRTDDGGRSWKAMVEEAVGVVRNISRSADGKYVAVSSRGNFYSTWEPGQSAWQPHNRNSSRRVQNMGYTADGQLWMLARGGQIQFTDPDEPDTWKDPISPEFATSWGLLDLAYRTPDEVWVSGGSGNLLRSLDGGVTWEKDRAVEDVPSNFYKILFFGSNQGFVMGQNGILLKYEPSLS
ncbi:photosynthesis system II assembly factor Ycf48 [Leptothermofonsia sichuanensis E412]|uniref:photosynthesis system II assembly factor Ycf48 n=1 Tax=Leptothermofonsia sichuanensis TaxID=2917832 RepID=UPI001CA6F719|nr:photosynthesis system II assembly factor Ycf48 [Leptothermofonsia sichuanensis]QZZ21244.1 photosynthesis system II assembly factor Ycf48 [Leptothermofonsia sichuanensis E412]